MSGHQAAAGGATREVIVPDLDRGQPVHVLRVVEHVLLAVARFEHDAFVGPGERLQLPVPFAGERALGAVERVQRVLRGTQRLDGDPQRGDLCAPGGRRRHVPLSVVTVAAGDVEDLAAVARAIGAPVAPEAIEDAVEAMAQAYDTTRAEIAENLARLAGLLDLAWTADADLLAPRIRATACGTHVWLTDAEEAAYGRLADRLNTMTTGSGVDRWLY